MTPPPWSYDNQKLVLHNVRFKASNVPAVECAMILDPRMIPLIPKDLSVVVVVPDPPCFEIRDAGEKGAGMFASRYIPAGSLILAEHPAIIIPGLSLPREFAAYEALYAALPEHIRTDLLKMANWKSEEECSIEEGIARTNGTDVDLLFPDEMNGDQVELRRGREYGATFLKIDRCNHSCSPNAAHKWDVTRFASYLYALRDIRAGEEVCITYTDIMAPRQTRRAKLQKSYGFLCSCQGCSLKDQHEIESHEGAMELIEREGLHALQRDFIEEIALCHAVLGNEEAFWSWGMRLIDLARIPDPQLASRFETWINSTKSMKIWAWRRNQRQQQSRRVVQDRGETYDLSLLLSS
ncbi:hypothetical protein APHAL10511_003596 [Amanita phalloides]|nr:hypothetical protein APHAL10511_003596 [Amanita phalloides]